MEDLHLLNSIAIAIGLAFAGGLVAHIIGFSPLVGYLLAGMVIGPFTPGYDADTGQLRQVAELGVIFLMFGVGLHFNLHALYRVRRIAISGATAQVSLAVLLAIGAASVFGLTWREGLVLGLSLGMASTVVLIRALTQRGLLESVHGQVAVGWLVVEDLATVLMLALIPSLAPGEADQFWGDTAVAMGKAAVFLVLALTAGARYIPLLLERVALTGQRELFILSVVAIALAIATGAAVFGLSVAIGAFIAGVVISESDTSHQAAADVLPLREAFSVLFFVSVGMLLDPEVVLDNVGLLVAVCFIVIVWKPVVAIVASAAFPYPARTGLVVAAGLAQIGEFSFIVANLGLDEGVIGVTTYNVILAASVISIGLNPLAWWTLPPLERFLRGSPPLWRLLDRQGPPPEAPSPLHDHVVIAGFGRVGELTGHALLQLDVPFLVIEADVERSRRLFEAGVPVVWGDAASEEVLRRARLKGARLLVVA
ncbi:MAG: cation:proton antiporter, partial [Dehalococcoidia bacterium]|nr:cation:proton antiporter [Dehalococcoidia bacterium]